MNFPATSPTKETSGVTFSVTSRRSLDCGRPTTGSDEGNSSRDFEMNRLAVHHFRYRAPIISGNFKGDLYCPARIKDDRSTVALLRFE